jgi:hypothetical protein
MLRVVDIAVLVGVTKQRAHQHTQREDFPWPVGTYERGDLWAKGQVKRDGPGRTGVRWGERHPWV